MNEKLAGIQIEDDLIERVRKSISGTILIGVSDQHIGPDESFLQRGILDSTGVLELVSLIEDQFGIRVDDDDITPENLNSLRSIASYLLRKLDQAS